MTTTTVANQIRFRCPGCSRSYRAPGRLMGKQVSCANCKTTVRLGGATHKPAPGPAALDLAPLPGPVPNLDGPLDLRPAPTRHSPDPDEQTPEASRRERRKRVRRRERRDPNLQRALDEAANGALMWGILGWFLFFPAFFAIKKAGDARYLARRMGVSVPPNATGGLVLGWIVVGSFLTGLLFLFGSIAFVFLSAA